MRSTGFFQEFPGGVRTATNKSKSNVTNKAIKESWTHK